MDKTADTLNNISLTDKTLIYNDNNIRLYNDDCKNGLKNIKDKSIQTICIDPPYNIGKDTWDTIDNYIDSMTDIIQILETKLKDNGCFFMFHNDMEQISELMVSIKKNTKLKFKQMIVWNKRFNESKKKGYLD